MDERFPRYLRVVVNKLSFLALPNLGMLLAGFAVLGFVGKTMLGAPMEQFLFDPDRVLAGEWWRLITFPVSEAPTNPLILLFYCLYVYFIVGALESAWGAGPLTVFTLFAYLCALGGSFFVGAPVPIWIFVIENLSLAFGTVFPEVELHLFGIIPVKAKWLAVLAGVILLIQFLGAGVFLKVFYVIVLLPYLVFFGPLLFRLARMKWSTSRRRKRFDQDMWR